MMQIHIQQGLPADAKMIRQEVFVDEQGFREEFDTLDHTAWHLILYEEQQPAGCCRIFPAEEAHAYTLGRLAVRKAFRGKHYGERLVRAAERWATEHQGRKLSLSAQVRVRPFYEKIGYTASGGEYLDEQCPHIHMEKELDA